MDVIHPTVIVLAAGQGRRFRASGGAGSKLDALLQGKAVLTHVLEAVEQSQLPFYVVHQAEGSGMSDSIAHGVRATPQANGWLILPGDLPLISPHTLRAVAQQLCLAQYLVVVPFKEGQRGHPVGFQHSCFSRLSQLTGEQGAASVVQVLRAQNQVLDFPVEDLGSIQDIDTLEDLHQAELYKAADQGSETH